jgi:hypothetical protein
VNEEVRNYFRPELVNRFDETVRLITPAAPTARGGGGACCEGAVGGWA